MCDILVSLCKVYGVEVVVLIFGGGICVMEVVVC